MLADALGDLANCGVYAPGDIVFISAEGRRSGRLTPDFAEIRLAARSGVTFVTDPLGQGQNGTRSSPYNQGEREVAAELERLGYTEENGNGLWTK